MSDSPMNRVNLASTTVIDIHESKYRSPEAPQESETPALWSLPF